MNTPDLQAMLQEARKGFVHINQIAWLGWGSLLLLHMPATSVINDKLEVLTIRIQEAEDSFTNGLITQEEYNVVTMDIEEKKGLLEREMQLVGGGSLGKDRKGESEESENAGAAGSLYDNHPTPRPKRKAVDALEDIRGDVSVVGDTGSTTAVRPPIPMMTVPRRKKEKGPLKQVASSSGVDDDEEPEGPVSDCSIHFATKLIHCAYRCRSMKGQPPCVFNAEKRKCEKCIYNKRGCSWSAEGSEAVYVSRIPPCQRMLTVCRTC
jgi:hypothetical protein